MSGIDFVALIAAVSTLIFFTIALSANNKLKKQTGLNKEHQIKLNKNPVEKLATQLQNQQATIQEKYDKGMPIYQKINKALNQNKKKLDHINAGLAPPLFKFDDSEQLKQNIRKCHAEQFIAIRNDKYATSYSNWSFFGSKTNGTKMVNAYKKLMLNAFNDEFNLIRTQMRHSSYDTAEKKLDRLSEQLSKLGETAKVEISTDYFILKLNELRVWHEELIHKEELKRAKKEQQALLRAQNKNIKDDSEEIEDELYYRKADLEKAQKIAQELYGDSAVKVELEIKSILDEINALEKKLERAQSQAQITKVGYIYVISNIGSFGEGIVKIGMTRRLEPLDRVNELGDASVPFKFDVHTLAFVDNAPSIEKQLHQKFNNQRVNVKNHRKEFFRVTPQEVQNAIQELGIESDWYFDVEAKEYRESILMRKAIIKEREQQKASVDVFPESI